MFAWFSIIGWPVIDLDMKNKNTKTIHVAYRIKNEKNKATR